MPGTILVVDDHASSRNALATLLRESGYDPILAADASGALQALAGSVVDLVLLDVGLPKVNGLELLDQLRRTRSPVELPVIMVTAASESDVIVGALRRGASDYVTKPVDFAVLLARLHTQLQLCQLSRLKDEFLRIASHDLKNPLTAILLAADSLGDACPVGTAMSEEGRRYLDAIEARAKQMRRIIADFLDLGALRDGRLAAQLAPADLQQLAARSVESNLPYARSKSISLALVAGAPPLPLRADAARITQVIENLLSNAIKFTPPGGAVEVAVVESGDGVRIEVRDDGPGLAELDFTQLFVVHARLSNRPTGGESSTGLGLALCKRLVELHGGRIGANRRERGGACFWFELPRT